MNSKSGLAVDNMVLDDVVFHIVFPIQDEYEDRENVDF